MTANIKRGRMSIGIDLIDISRMAVKMKRNKDFIHTFLCKNETDSLKTLNFNESVEYAARVFAIKEAVLKALKIGIGNGLELCEIEVLKNCRAVKIDKKPFDKKRFAICTCKEDNLLIATAIIY